MSQRVFDRVKETGSVTGTGPVTLSGAATGGFKTFSSRFASGAAYHYADPIYYCITDASGNWEVGKGFLTSATSLTRGVQASSNSDALVSFAGAVEVFCTIPAERIEEIWTKGQTNTLVRGWCMA